MFTLWKSEERKPVIIQDFRGGNEMINGDRARKRLEIGINVAVLRG